MAQNAQKVKTQGGTKRYRVLQDQRLDLIPTLAESIHDPIVHCAVYDDDIFTYEFYLGGEQIDAYNSCPDYFGGTTVERGGSLNRIGLLLI